MQGRARLNKEALHFRIHDKNIYELASMDINELYDWLQQVDPFLEDKQRMIAAEILKEIRTRLKSFCWMWDWIIFH